MHSLPFEFQDFDGEPLESWRASYRQMHPCQLIHDSLHRRSGWTRSVRFLIRGVPAGYASMAIAGPWHERPALFELFCLPEYQDYLMEIFPELITRLGPVQIETQSNTQPLAALALIWGKQVVSESVLFAAGRATQLVCADAALRRSQPGDAEAIERLDLDRGAEWVLEFAGELVGTGGILTHYNPPFGDIYMRIAERFRRRGLGSFLVQELMSETRRCGLIPAARCRVENLASKLTLQKAGFDPCGILFHTSLI